MSDWPVLDHIFSLDLNTDLIRITQTESRGEPLLEEEGECHSRVSFAAFVYFLSCATRVHD